jgi:hypothetical protein
MECPHPCDAQHPSMMGLVLTFASLSVSATIVAIFFKLLNKCLRTDIYEPIPIQVPLNETWEILIM